MKKILQDLRNLCDSLFTKVDNLTADNDALKSELAMIEANYKREMEFSTGLCADLKLTAKQRDEALEEAKGGGNTVGYAKWQRDTLAGLFTDAEVKDRILGQYPDKKIQAIKAWRGYTGKGLKEAKADVDQWYESYTNDCGSGHPGYLQEVF